MKILGRRRLRRFKSQSAMEYLMTYGWAILIIAVVLGALYSLGVFNSTNFAPKAPPGSCQVFRPNGPGTTFDLNLMGVCNGELPEYVASLNGKPYTQQLIYTNSLGAEPLMTVTAWVYLTKLVGFTVAAGPVVAGIDCTGQHIFLTVQTGSVGVWGGCEDTWPLNNVVSVGNWYFLAYTYNSLNGALRVYVDKNFANASISYPNSIAMNQFDIGNGNNGNVGQSAFYGYIANVQYYNAVLSSNDINALYQEGIGGAPIDLQNLVGWWPLNGNANDYSGNGNNGVPINVTFVSNWYSGYTPP